MYFFRVARRLESLHGFNLVGIYFYPPVGDQVPQKFVSPYSKGAFFCVKMQSVLSQHLEHSLEILYMSGLLLTFHHHIVDVHFDRIPYFIPKHPRYHPLVCRPCIF